MRDLQDDLRRPAFREPYDTGLVLVVSRVLLRETHRFFSPCWHARVEAACFWIGVQHEALQVATTLALPEVKQSRGHYRVEPESLRRLAADMRAQGLTNLAQVHTHPTSWVGHSCYDDENAYSTREGALSLVWPDYGAALYSDLHGLGIHERQSGRWARLDPVRVERRIRLVDSEADFRWRLSPWERDDED